MDNKGFVIWVIKVLVIWVIIIYGLVIVDEVVIYVINFGFNRIDLIKKKINKFYLFLFFFIKYNF